MPPENFNKQATETSEGNDASEVLTNKERTAENDMQKWADETNLDTENTTEVLSENEKLAKSLLEDPQFSELTDDEKEKIYQKALSLIEEYEVMGFPITLNELKKEFGNEKGRVETISVQSEFETKNLELVGKNMSLTERLTSLQKEFAGKLPEDVQNSLNKMLAVANFAENDKTITKEEKELIQTKLGSADLFSPGGFETVMYAVYSDESISEETKEKLISVSGVVNVPQREVTTPSDLTDDLKNREDARKEQFSKLKKQEKTLTKEKEKLEAIPESERTEEQQEELEELEKQLQTVQKQKEYFDKENRGTVTRRTMSMGGTAELSKSSLFFPAKTIMELNGKRIPLLGSATKQNQAIDCLYSADRLQNGNGKRTPLYLGDFIYGKIENGKPIAPAQLDISKTVRQYMSIGDNNEIITNQELKETEKVFQAFRNPNSTRNKEGARQDLIELGLLNKGEKKLSLDNVHKLGAMIQFIRNTPTLPPKYDNMHDYLKDKFGKKEDKK